MRKGDLVKMTDAAKSRVSWTTQQFLRPITDAELVAYYAVGYHLGLDDAGEPKLPPSAAYDDLSPDTMFIVLKARCAPRLGYRTYPGMMEVMNPQTGTKYFVKKINYEVA